jgi:16S rRNA (cytosine1402-N4)-methyltransferase
MGQQYHEPVLLQAVCEAFQVQSGHLYVDATLGGGGHARQIISLGGKVLGIDQDPDSLSACPDQDQLIKARGSFSHLEEIVKKNGWKDVSGVLFDLGVSSHQLDTPERGFSFQSEGPLDMRMDPSSGITAADLANTLSAKQLIQMMREFGEEKNARVIADRIISKRPLLTTRDLADVLPDPKTRRRVFQAFRIAVNDEMGELEKALPQALGILAPGGKIVVISFHSLEDRIVKNQFQKWQDAGIGKIENTNPITPSAIEMTDNSRSKSSKLRIFKKND